jgi:hypothetical protein
VTGASCCATPGTQSSGWGEQGRDGLGFWVGRRGRGGCHWQATPGLAAGPAALHALPSRAVAPGHPSALLRLGRRFVLWYIMPPVPAITEYTGTAGAIMSLFGIGLALSAALLVGMVSAAMLHPSPVREGTQPGGGCEPGSPCTTDPAAPGSDTRATPACWCVPPQWSFMGEPQVPRRLVTAGPYLLCRHPQALGNLLFLIGAPLVGGGAPVPRPGGPTAAPSLPSAAALGSRVVARRPP